MHANYYIILLICPRVVHATVHGMVLVSHTRAPARARVPALQYACTSLTKWQTWALMTALSISMAISQSIFVFSITPPRTR